MKALRWYGSGDVRIESVPDPEIKDPKDAIIKISSTAIGGSDLHVYDGYVPTMEQGDILGHENMGEVVETGSEVRKLQIGDRVVVPFNIACGECFFCKEGMSSLCDHSNPNAEMAKKIMGHSPSGQFGYSHMLGGFSGGQAEYLRVPYAEVGPLKVPCDLPDEKLLFLSDTFPTGYMAAENCQIRDGDTVAVWGCGPVGQFAIRSAWMLGAGRVIAIDNIPARLNLAALAPGSETINFDDVDVYDALMDMTDSRGPDSCIDAVGCEAHAGGILSGTSGTLEPTNGSAISATDRPHVIRQTIMSCRKGGTVSISGNYVGYGDKIPIGAAMNKGLTIKQGQTYTHRYMPQLLNKIQDGEIDPSFVITHQMSLDDAPEAYEMFKNKEDECIKVVLKP